MSSPRPARSLRSTKVCCHDVRRQRSQELPLMNRTALTAWIMAASCLLTSSASAQGTRSDYERANTLRRRLEGTVFRARVTPHWYAGGARFWYRNDLPGGEREFIRVDAAGGVRAAA